MSDLKFSKEHMWVKLDGNIATIGVSDFAQQELGDIVFIELPEEGSEVSKGKSFGTIESVKAVSDLYAPLSGKVVEFNELLDDEPETVNSDPYQAAWILKIELSDTAQTESLISEDNYAKFIEESKS